MQCTIIFGLLSSYGLAATTVVPTPTNAPTLASTVPATVATTATATTVVPTPTNAPTLASTVPATVATTATATSGPTSTDSDTEENDPSSDNKADKLNEMTKNA